MSSPLIATNDSDLDDALLDVVMELGRARAKFGPMVSEREGMDVVSEEHHEMQLAMWYGVDARGRPSDPHDEAIQLAAMAVRFLLDVPRRKRHVIRLIAGGAGHDPEPVCDGCGKPWPCEEGADVTRDIEAIVARHPTVADHDPLAECVYHGPRCEVRPLAVALTAAEAREKATGDTMARLVEGLERADAARQAAEADAADLARKAAALEMVFPHIRHASDCHKWASEGIPCDCGAQEAHRIAAAALEAEK